MSRQFLSQVMPSIRGSVAISAIVMFSFVPLSGCELTQNHTKIDREKDMAFQDYRDAMAPRLPQIDETNASDMSSIPPLQPYVAQPGANSKVMPLVSISVNQTIPLRDVLYEVADQANYDVEIDPRIRGAIIFSAKNRPLDVVIERISEIAGLRFSFDDDIMRVEIDTPYHKTYKINYLALKRDNASSISNDISIVSGEGSDTGSNFSAVNESSIDFWAELETNLTQILESNRDANSLLTSKDPRISAVQENPAPVTPIVMDAEGNISETGPNVQVQAPNTVLRVETLEEEDETADTSEEDPFAARFSLNKQAGMVSVFAPERLHKRVDEYMKDLKKSVSAQVLIEAKVLEVTLNDEFSAGINWGAVDLFEGTSLGFGLASGSVRGVLNPAPTPSSDFGFNYTGNDFTAAIDALSRFGTVHALASPRLTVLNNQSAALNVAKNVVYFEIEAETTSSDSGIVTTFETDAKTVPEGVLINVQPAIDLDRRTVSMAVRPTVTNIDSFTNDPNPELVGIGRTATFEGVTVTSPVPVVNVQEFDSIIQVNSGQAVVLGGLIQDRSSSTQNGVPILSEMPFVGAAFRNQQDEIKKTELVVFLQATIVEGNNTVHDTDKDLYRTFSQDRRPLKF